MAYTAPEIPASHKGLLHKKMGIKQGKKIGLSSLMSEKRMAKREGNGKLEKEANFAIVTRSWHHK